MRRHASFGSTVSAQRNSLLLGLALLLETSSLGGSRTYRRTAQVVKIIDQLKPKCSIWRGVDVVLSCEVSAQISNVYKIFKDKTKDSGLKKNLLSGCIRRTVVSWYDPQSQMLL